jgi:hypothetical protein
MSARRKDKREKSKRSQPSVGATETDTMLERLRTAEPLVTAADTRREWVYTPTTTTNYTVAEAPTAAMSFTASSLMSK